MAKFALLFTSARSTCKSRHPSGKTTTFSLSGKNAQGNVGVNVGAAIGVGVAVGVNVGVRVGVEVMVGVGVKEAVGVGPVGVTVGVNVREAVGVGPVGETVGVSTVGDGVAVVVFASGAPMPGVAERVAVAEDCAVAASPSWREITDDSQATTQPRQIQSANACTHTRPIISPVRFMREHSPVNRFPRTKPNVTN